MDAQTDTRTIQGEGNSPLPLPTAGDGICGANAAPAATTPVPIRKTTPCCTHLLCKKKFAGEKHRALAPRDPMDDHLDHYYWCARTMDVLGPDKEIASESACDPSRECFEGER
ncbi:MAG: hypothetical protein HY720_04940 [Planctomycetes bacterium]|nr:hypothetical protein [Planctomycetota bacterium]